MKAVSAENKVFGSLHGVETHGSQGSHSFQFIFNPVFKGGSHAIFGAGIIESVNLFLLHFFLEERQFGSEYAVFISFGICKFRFEISVVYHLCLLRVFVLYIIPVPCIENDENNRNKCVN